MRGVLRVQRPTGVTERIEVLDIIRGYALFGVLLVNMVMINSLLMEFGAGLDLLSQPARLATAWERTTAWIVQIFFQGKFYTIFAFLFGLGFYLFLNRNEAQAGTNRRLFVRRVSILLAIGLLHMIFIWWGDVLFTYALIGFLLMLFRTASFGQIRAWATGLLLISFALLPLSVFMAAPQWAEGGAALEAMAPFLEQARAVYQEGTYWELVVHRWRYEFLGVLVNAIAMIPRILGLFLVGLYVGKLGIFQRVADHLPLIARARTIGLVGGGLLTLAHVGLQLGILEGYLTPVASSAASMLLREVSTPLISLFYVTCIIGIWHSGALSGVFSGLATLGRMALTNYLVQCVVLAWLFYGHGLGLMGMSIAYMPAIALAIYVAQIALSRFWLERYNQGPAEWVWRRLTYGTSTSSSI